MIVSESFAEGGSINRSQAHPNFPTNHPGAISQLKVGRQRANLAIKEKGYSDIGYPVYGKTGGVTVMSVFNLVSEMRKDKHR